MSWKNVWFGIAAMTTVVGCGIAEAPTSDSESSNATVKAAFDSHGPVPGGCYTGLYEDWDLDEEPPLHLCIRVTWRFEENPNDARVDWEWDRGCTGTYEPQWGGPMHNEGRVDDFEVPGCSWNGWDPDGEGVIYNSDAQGNLLACVSVDRPGQEEPIRQCFALKPCSGAI